MKPLRVLIDARMLMGRFSGVARMVTQLVEHLAITPDMCVTALCGIEAYEPWLSRSDIRLLTTDFRRSDRSAWRRLWWEATRLPYWIAQSGAEVFHATWNTGIPLRCPIPSVLTIHDIIPWDKLSGAARHIYRYSLLASARRASKVVTVSQFTAGELHHRIRLDTPQIRVIYNGVIPAPATESGNPRHSGEPYVLYVGGHEARKNVEGVLATVQEYWRTFNPRVRLRLTGAKGDLDAEARRAYEEVKDDPRIEFLGSLGDDELLQQYQHAAALLVLSRAEGFGLPVVEAMAHGCPVIAARCGSLPEVVGDAGILVDPDQPREAAAAIHRVLDAPCFSEALIAKGRSRAAAFSWASAAKAYGDEYRSAHGNRNKCIRGLDDVLNGDSPPILDPSTSLG